MARCQVATSTAAPAGHCDRRKGALHDLSLTRARGVAAVPAKQAQSRRSYEAPQRRLPIMTSSAVILAAGRGCRMYPLTRDIPKALLPIGVTSAGLEETFIGRQIAVLRAAGVETITIVVSAEGHAAIARHVARRPGIEIVVNSAGAATPSGSLHSLQFAYRGAGRILDGSHPTLMLDGDIVFHRSALGALMALPGSCLLVHTASAHDDEQVLVYGTCDRPSFIGKGLDRELTNGAPCLGEAMGIVKYAPEDHQLARRIIDWSVGDPSAPAGSLARLGFGPARTATEHEELTKHLMSLGRLRALESSLPFMEADTPEEYERLRSNVYPQLVELETPELELALPSGRAERSAN